MRAELSAHSHELCSISPTGSRRTAESPGRYQQPARRRRPTTMKSAALYVEMALGRRRSGGARKGAPRAAPVHVPTLLWCDGGAVMPLFPMVERPWWRPSWLDTQRHQGAETSGMMSTGGFPTRHIDMPDLGSARSAADVNAGRSGSPYCTYSVIGVHAVVSFALMSMAAFEFSDISPGSPPRVPNWIGAQQSLVYSGEYWRIFTGIWLHPGLIQLVLTVIAVYRAGGEIEHEHGATTFASLYLLSSLGGAMTSVIFSYPKEVGACGSGGIFGLFASDLAYFVHNYYQLGAGRWRYLAVSVSLTLSGLLLGLHPIMNNYAHIGGFFTGLILSMALLARFEKVRGHPWLRYNQKTLIACCAFTTLSVVMFALFIAQLSMRQASPCSWCHFADCIPLPWWTCPRSKKF